MYVIRFPDQNTLNTKVKQIRNPQKEISGGFFVIGIFITEFLILFDLKPPEISFLTQYFQMVLSQVIAYLIFY